LELGDLFFFPALRHVSLLSDLEIRIPERVFSLRHFVDHKENNNVVLTELALLEDLGMRIEDFSNLGVISELLLMNDNLGGHI
jgi:hypothetical protein